MEYFKTIIDRILLCVVLASATSVGLILLLPLFLGADFGNYGSFIGDLLGTLIGGITVYLVYQTYKLQEKELTETRNQLKIQNFETMFFNMLNVFGELDHYRGSLQR